MAIQKLQKLLRKYPGGSILTRATEEAFTRSYRLSSIRRMVKPFFRIPHTEKWVFIVGCYNSGTTLLQNIVGHHPDIASLPREGVRFTSTLPQPEDLGWTRMWAKCLPHMEMTVPPDEGAYQRIQADWAPLWNNSDATTRLEKSITNVTRMEWLDQCFPNAHFIGIWRDGYCVSEGIQRRAKPEVRTGYGRETYTSTLAAQQWVAANEKLHQDALKVNRYMGLSYEGFVAEPVGQMQRIYSFLDLSLPDIEMSGDSLSINGQSQRLSDQNQSSIKRLSSEQIAEINPVIEEMQQSLGYQLINAEGHG